MRITKDDRDHWLRRLMTDAFGKTDLAMAKRENEVAEQHAKHVWPGIDDVPKGWLPTKDHIYVQAPGGREILRFGRTRPVPDDEDGYSRAGRTQSVYADVFIRERAIYRANREATESKAAALLKSCTTTKQLVERWPEAAAKLGITGKEETKKTALAVYKATDELNAALGLKPTK